MDIASPSIDTDELAVSLPAVAAPKSPPLAFAKPTGDSLVPQHALNGQLPTSPSQSIMGRFSPLSESPLALQAIVDKQGEALRQLHKAFQAERESWDLERERMFARIHSLEQLLRNGEHHR